MEKIKSLERNGKNEKNSKILNTKRLLNLQNVEQPEKWSKAKTKRKKT